MEKRKLGRSGIAIAPLMFGGNVFGWTADEITSFAILDAFIDQGGNAIDTADVYSAWVPGHQGGEGDERRAQRGGGERPRRRAGPAVRQAGHGPRGDRQPPSRTASPSSPESATRFGAVPAGAARRSSPGWPRCR